MPAIRLLCTLFAVVAGLAASLSHAQVITPPLPIVPTGSGVSNATPDLWGVGGVQNVGTVSAGGYTSSLNNLNSAQQLFASPVDITTPATVASGASAFAASDALSLHSATSALSSDPLSGPSGALAASSVIYSVWLTGTSDPITLDFNLNGSLITTGSGTLSSDPTRAGVVFSAIGSLNDPNPDAYNNEYIQAGIDPTVTGQAALNQFANYPTARVGTLTTFGQLASLDPGHPSALVNQDLSVTAQGIPIVCPAGITGGGCGTTFYWFAVTLLTGAENGASANFGHTLTATGLQVPAGTQINFAPGQAIPVTTVPEPATWASLLAGAGLLLLSRRRSTA